MQLLACLLACYWQREDSDGFQDWYFTQSRNQANGSSSTSKTSSSRRAADVLFCFFFLSSFLFFFLTLFYPYNCRKRRQSQCWSVVTASTHLSPNDLRGPGQGETTQGMITGRQETGEVWALQGLMPVFSCDYHETWYAVWWWPGMDARWRDYYCMLCRDRWPVGEWGTKEPLVNARYKVKEEKSKTKKAVDALLY